MRPRRSGTRSSRAPHATRALDARALLISVLLPAVAIVTTNGCGDFGGYHLHAGEPGPESGSAPGGGPRPSLRSIPSSRRKLRARTANARPVARVAATSARRGPIPRRDVERRRAERAPSRTPPLDVRRESACRAPARRATRIATMSRATDARRTRRRTRRTAVPAGRRAQRARCARLVHAPAIRPRAQAAAPARRARLARRSLWTIQRPCPRETTACWGKNANGESTPPAGTFRRVSVGHYPPPAWNGFSCGLRQNGSVTCWGAVVSAPPGGTFTQIGAGAARLCGLRGDGEIDCWGAAAQDAPPGPYRRVVAGWSSTCGIRADDTVMCWNFGLTPPSGLVVR